LPKEFPYQKSFLAKRVSLPKEFLYQKSFLAKRVSLPKEFPYQKNFFTKRISLSNETPCQRKLRIRSVTSPYPSAVTAAYHMELYPPDTKNPSHLILSSLRLRINQEPLR
jgi:hypothetical protein